MIDNLLHFSIKPYSVIFGFAFIISLIFVVFFLSISKYKKLEISLAFIQCLSSLLLIISDNIIILFISYEIITISSIILILNDKPNYNYCLTHLFSGIIMIAGISLHIAETGSYLLNSFEDYNINLSHLLIICALLINLGVYPLSFILIDTYSKLNKKNFSLISIYNTKITIYLLINMFAGYDILIYLGIIMFFYGIIYASFEICALRILCYMMISQLGFLIILIGVGGSSILNAVAVISFCSIFYQLLLINIINLVPEKKVTLNLIYIIIAIFSISSMPLSISFVSKSILNNAITDIAYLKNISMIANISNILILAMRFFYLLFFINKSKINQSDSLKISTNHFIANKYKVNLPKIGITTLALMNMTLGFYPEYLYDMLPHNKLEYSIYSSHIILKQLLLLIISGLLFVISFFIFSKLKIKIPDIDFILNKISDHPRIKCLYLIAKNKINILNKSSFQFFFNIIKTDYFFVVKRNINLANIASISLFCLALMSLINLLYMDL